MSGPSPSRPGGAGDAGPPALSDPAEIDHFLFAGRRDWSMPLRALVLGDRAEPRAEALAEALAGAGRTGTITCLAEPGGARRPPGGPHWAGGAVAVRFVEAPLDRMARIAPFDYIACAGLLHRLEDPAGALGLMASALTPGGGIGLSVPAPFGRLGLDALQEVFATVLTGSDRDRMRRARAILGRLPAGHPVLRNADLAPALVEDADLAELLLRGRERPFRIGALRAALADAGLPMTGSPSAYLYDPLPLLGDKALLYGLEGDARMDLAEALRATIGSHLVYAAPEGAARLAKPGPDAVPHLRGVAGPDIAQEALSQGVIPVRHDEERAEIPVPALAVRALALIDGRRSLDEIARDARTDWTAFAPIWAGVSAALCAQGLMVYSGVLRP